MEAEDVDDGSLELGFFGLVNPGSEQKTEHIQRNENEGNDVDGWRR